MLICLPLHPRIIKCTKVMIREKDFVELAVKKMLNDINKGVIRRFYPPQIAAQKCNAIDEQEKLEHFMRFVNEMNEWEMRRRYAMLQFLMQ